MLVKATFSLETHTGTLQHVLLAMPWANEQGPGAYSQEGAASFHGHPGRSSLRHISKPVRLSSSSLSLVLYYVPLLHLRYLLGLSRRENWRNMSIDRAYSSPLGPMHKDATTITAWSWTPHMSWKLGLLTAALAISASSPARK